MISSLPLRTTVGITEPEAPVEVRDAARGLRYRDFLTVAAGDRRRGPVPRQLDLHPRAGRPRAAHPELPVLEPVDGARTRPTPRSAWSTSASRATSCGTWPTTTWWRWPAARSRSCTWPSAEQGQVRLRRARAQGLSDLRRRVRRARRRRSAAGSRAIDNLIQVGRNGLHRYNNSDHSMLTAMRAVDNILLGHPPRHLGGQRRERVPRGARRARAALQGARPRRRRWSSRSRRSGRRGDGPLRPVLLAVVVAARRWRRYRRGVGRRVGAGGVPPHDRRLRPLGASRRRSRRRPRIHRTRSRRASRSRRLADPDDDHAAPVVPTDRRPSGSSGLSGSTAIGIAVGAFVGARRDRVLHLARRPPARAGPSARRGGGGWAGGRQRLQAAPEAAQAQPGGAPPAQARSGSVARRDPRGSRLDRAEVRPSPESVPGPAAAGARPCARCTRSWSAISA